MFKKYKPFFRTGAMDLLAFKFNLFSWFLITLLQVICVLFLWTSVFKNAPDGLNSVINGFSFKEMITYTIFINIFNFVAFSNNTIWMINDEIKDGTIAMSFIKPISYRIRFVFINLGSVFMQNIILGIPCFIIFYIIFGCLGYINIVSISTLLIHILLFIISLLVATLLNDVINYIFGVLCFYTSSGFGINQIKNVIIGFLSGSLLPISFFPGIFGEIVSYLPFAGMAQNPILIFLMKLDSLESLKTIGLSILWLIILEFIAWLLFRNASKKVTVQGG